MTASYWPVLEQASVKSINWLRLNFSDWVPAINSCYGNKKAFGKESRSHFVGDVKTILLPCTKNVHLIWSKRIWRYYLPAVIGCILRRTPNTIKTTTETMHWSHLSIIFIFPFTIFTKKCQDITRMLKIIKSTQLNTWVGAASIASKSPRSLRAQLWSPHWSCTHNNSWQCSKNTLIG